MVAAELMEKAAVDAMLNFIGVVVVFEQCRQRFVEYNRFEPGSGTVHTAVIRGKTVVKYGTYRVSTHIYQLPRLKQ